MTDPASVPPGNHSLSNDQMELFRFLREQAEANRNALREEVNANRAAQREDAESVRKLFTTTSSIVAIPLAVAIALAGMFWYRDVNSMKDALEREGKAAEKAEIDRMNAQIDVTLQEQFTTKSMQDRIDKAAEAATEGKAKTLIEDRVRSMTEPIQREAQTQLAAIHVQELIARANADDAKAFDDLLSLRDKGDSNQQALIEGVIADKHRNEYLQANGGGQSEGCVAPLSPEFKKALHSPDVRVRKNVIASCDAYIGYQPLDIWLPGQSKSGVETEELIPPILANIAHNDPSLSVRYEAITAFNDAFRYSPGFPENGLDPLDSSELDRWWQENKSHYEQLLLLSLVAPPDSQRFNTISLYDDLISAAKSAPQSLRKDLRLRMEQMRSLAIRRNSDSLATLTKDMARGATSCDEVERDFSLRLNQERKMSLEVQQRSYPDYGMWELEYVKTCKSNTQLLKQISAVMGQTHLLDRRYGATMVVNRWTGNDLDPFDTTAIRKWREQNKQLSANNPN